ncbi:MAG: response regulator [Bacteroidales bacterium]|nr:response regulator [Bacteroidales bacterium]
MQTPLIYIIDNNLSYRKITENCLLSSNYAHFRSFDDGESCYVSKAPVPDIIITDYNLGEGRWCGTDFMEEYSRINNSVVFIFLSSNLKIEIAVEAVKLGAKDYILKSKAGLTRLIKQLDIVKGNLMNNSQLQLTSVTKSPKITTNL